MACGVGLLLGQQVAERTGRAVLLGVFVLAGAAVWSTTAALARRG